jgi:hypothetical protein
MSVLFHPAGLDRTSSLLSGEEDVSVAFGEAMIDRQPVSSGICEYTAFTPELRRG